MAGDTSWGRPAADVDALRFTLLDTLARLTGGATGADSPAVAFRAAPALLHPAAPAPDGDRVDEFVALATVIVHGADPAGAGVDRFLLAVALLLRHHLDDDSRADDSRADDSRAADGSRADDSGDLEAAVGHLLAAAEILPATHPAAATVIESLPAFLEGRQSFGGVLDGTAARFAARATAVLTTAVLTTANLAGAAGSGPAPVGPAAVGGGLPVLDAVRCLCEVASAARGERRRAVRELDRAVRALPDSYPWLPRLRAVVLAADTEPAA